VSETLLVQPGVAGARGKGRVAGAGVFGSPGHAARNLLGAILGGRG